MKVIRILKIAGLALLTAAFLMFSIRIADDAGAEVKQGNKRVTESIQYTSESYRMLGDEVRSKIKEYCGVEGITVLLSTKRLQDKDLPDYKVKNLSDVSNSNDDWYLNPAGHFLVVVRKQADESVTIFVKEEGDYYY